ncbi:central glycolytic genes regulator [Gracilibacillus halotolerans]|uniref:Central glycolytic genes regulator n=1 Tax=Gracilibacillus halotolerans TaxID=74386 RepID=A0A841RRA4_9BACI|nr:sugar-binding domain-containing protein [Gracilibacillus halotolerans]MBB6513745.1 central glycolytic genes regulator [Gracilibacillus halotolerans]
MKELIDLQEKLFPDLLAVMERRYRIMHYIKMMEPIGRRSLADHMNMKERLIRSEIDFLNRQGFLHVTAKGMSLTVEGSNIVDKLANFINGISSFHVLESQIKERLHLEHVIIVPGNSDNQLSIKEDLGIACVQFLKGILTANQTVAITGGTTMALVAKHMKRVEHAENCTFVPARGGLGEQVENQANTICAEMAKKANGNYRMLYVPDPLSEETYYSIIEEPAIKDTLETIRKADIVLHGIGDAITMAKRRKAPERVIEKLKKEHAVSEAFGYYLDEEGEVVHKVRTVGMQLEDLTHPKYVIAIAGGKSKAKAIRSYLRQGMSNVLITDEETAEELLKG